MIVFCTYVKHIHLLGSLPVVFETHMNSQISTALISLNSSICETKQAPTCKMIHVLLFHCIDNS